MCFTCTTSSKVRSLEGGGVWVIENKEHFTVIVLQRRIRNFQCIHRSSRLQMIFKTGVLKISQISQENTCLHEEHLFLQENASGGCLCIQGKSLVHLRIGKTKVRSSHPDVFLEKSVLKIYSKFTGEHACRSTISITLQSNFIEIALRHGCSSANLPHIFRTPFPKDTSWRLLLQG